MAESDSTALGKDLAQTPLANVLIAALKQKATGQLTIRYPEGEHRIFFNAGIPAGSQLPDPVRRLGQMLVELSWISETQLEQSLQEKQVGERQGEALVKIGALTRDKLNEALQVQLIRNLVEIAKLPAGELAFEPIREAPPWAAGISLNALRILREVLAVEQSGPVCQALFQKLGEDQQVVIPPHLVATGTHFEFDAAEQAALRHLEAPLTLKQFFVRCQLPEGKARALVAELIVTNLLVSPEQAVPQGAEQLVHRVDDKSRERRRRMLDRAIASVGVGPFSRGQGGPAWRATELPPMEEMQSDELPEVAFSPATGDQAEDEERLRKLIVEKAKTLPGLDFYARLGLKPTATQAQVKEAFVGAVKIFHPDHLPPRLADLASQQQTAFAAIKEAYDTLQDEKLAREYRERMPGRPGGGIMGTDNSAARARGEEAKIFAHQGEQALRKRDYATAAESFHQAHDLAPRGEYAACEAWALFSDPGRKADQKRAREMLQAAAETYPDSDKAAQYLGVVARIEGRSADAETWLRRALALNPKNLEASNELHLLELRKRGR
jgi:curved DNA-binding protein CbpA